MTDLSYTRDFVRALKDERDALLAANQRLRDFIQAVADCEYYSAALRENAREALGG